MKSPKFTIGNKSFKLENGKVMVLREIEIPEGRDYRIETRWCEANPVNCGGDAQYKLAKERAMQCQIMR